MRTSSLKAAAEGSNSQNTQQSPQQQLGFGLVFIRIDFVEQADYKRFSIRL
jgi:hypothetical protein